MNRRTIKILLILIAITFVSCNKEDIDNKKAEWIKNAFISFESGNYPGIKAISWWNENWEDGKKQVRLRIDSSPESLDAYRQGVRSHTFING